MPIVWSTDAPFDLQGGRAFTHSRLRSHAALRHEGVGRRATAFLTGRRFRVMSVGGIVSLADPGLAEPEAEALMSVPAAGWYDDPEGRHPSRYWDGQNWTTVVVKDPAFVPPFEEWPRMRWLSSGPVRWWWTQPLAYVFGWTTAALATGSTSMALAGILTAPLGFAFMYWKYRTWRRRAGAGPST